jgi:LysM domain-containing protein
VSRFQKIFLASALVVVGFGVATFLGQPVLPTHLPNSRTAMQPLVSVGVQASPVTAGAPQAAGSVRLLPDLTSTRIGAPAMGLTASAPESPRLGSTLAPISTPPRTFDFAPASSAPIGDVASPRARLRNEAPRSVGIDPQSPAIIRRLPADNVDANDTYKVPNSNAGTQAWSAPPLLSASYTEASAPPIAMPASYSSSATMSDNGVPPPPWAAPEETTESRTHVVVDGDSLERLASRYLSDPQRSREIYELNRAVLSSPVLLPIGVELKIPDRVASTSWGRGGFQTNALDARSNRDAGSGAMTQARPAPAPQGIIPRAQLAQPVMVQ